MATKGNYNPVTGLRLDRGRWSLYLNDVEGATDVLIRATLGVTENCIALGGPALMLAKDEALVYRNVPVDLVKTARFSYAGGGIVSPTPGGAVAAYAEHVFYVPNLTSRGLTLELWNDNEDDDVELSVEVTYVE